MKEAEVSTWMQINNFIETPFTQYILLPLVQYFIIPLIILYITYIVVQKGIEKYKHTNTKELRIDDYYNEVSKEELINLIKDWTDLLQQTDLKMQLMAKKAEEELPAELILKNGEETEYVRMSDGTTINKISPVVYAFGNLIMTTWIYGKKDTNKLLSAFQQHNFLDKERETEYHNMKSIVYIAMIIVYLRKDLMNFESNPVELLKLKLTDISQPEIKQRFLECLKEVKKELEL